MRAGLAAVALCAALLLGACSEAGEERTTTIDVTVGEGATAGPEGSRRGEGGGGASIPRDPDLSGSCPNEDLVPAEGNARKLERAAFCLVNEVRADRGLSRLSRNGALAEAAAIHSRDMDRDDYFAHVSPQGTGLVGWVRGTGYLSGRGSYRLAENIGFGTASAGTPAGIVAGWMASPSHRENILDRRLREAGMGTVIGAPSSDPSATGAIYTQIFGG